MKIIHARNPHEALPEALYILKRFGKEEQSRNGPVISLPYPVVTEYSKPLERVVFWPEREANPFLHLYESLWMLAGRNDLKPLLKFTRNFENYSDDGKTIHDAYGRRWISHFAINQLDIIIGRLKRDPSDRRCVLTIWDPHTDLGYQGKAFPCNLSATFQIVEGRLDLNIFCRSNDIIWGTYGANCFHFSVLLEYMAMEIGCPVGIMRQFSMNWHAYPDTLKNLKNLHEEYKVDVQPISLCLLDNRNIRDPEFIEVIKKLLNDVDNDFHQERYYHNKWIQLANIILQAHHVWKIAPAPERYLDAIRILEKGNRHIDIIVAAKEWITRRYLKWEKKKRQLCSCDSVYCECNKGAIND